MKVVSIIQARRASSRFPDKIFKELGHKPLLWHVVNRIKPARSVDEILIATTTHERDDKIAEWGEKNGIRVFRGSEENVLSRYMEAAKWANADIIVRITSDDPFKDYRLIDRCVEVMKVNRCDFVCNNMPPSFPEGLDIEVITFSALKISNENASSDFEREHVTQYIHKNLDKFKVENISSSENLSHHRWTIDTEEDYLFVCKVYDFFENKKELFLPEDIYPLLEKNPLWLEINNKVIRSNLFRK